MAGTKLTDKSALVTTPASDDKLMIVDTSDTSSSSAGTSKKIDNKFILQTDRKTIDNTEFLALATTGKELVAAPGAGFVIIPESVYAHYTEGGTPNTETLNSRIGHVDQEVSFYWDSARFWMDSTSYDGGAFIYSGGAPASGGVVADDGTIEDKGLYYYFASAPTGGATGTLILYVTYRIIDVSL